MTKNNLGKKYGIIAGLGFIAYFLLFYFIDKTMMMGLTVSWSSLIIMIFCIILAIQQERSLNGGLIAFKPALRSGFLVVVISNLMYYAFFYLMTNSDPELVTILKDSGIEFYKKMLPEDQWSDIEKSYENFSLGISDIIKYFAKSVIGGFFIALLAGLVMKRESSRQA